MVSSSERQSLKAVQPFWTAAAASRITPMTTSGWENIGVLGGKHEEFEVRRAILNRFDKQTASALGFGPSAFAYDHLWELYFDSTDRRQTACKDPRFISRFPSVSAAPAPRALAAREYTIF